MNQQDNFPPQFRLNQWLVLPDLNRITGPDGEVQIEPRVMRVLLVLAEKPGQVVTRERLLDEVWGDSVVGEEILTRAVSELRRVFGDSARKPQYIETIRHHGYRLIVEVGPVVVEVPTAPASSAAAEPPPGATGSGRAVLRFVVIAGALMLLAMFGPRLLRNDSADPVSSGPPSAIPVTSYPGREQYPALSPDGTRVAFAWAGPEAGNIDIYIKQRNSESTLRLTDDTGWAAWPAWSPDGQSVAFVQGGEPRNVISIVPSLGGAARPLHEVSGWVEGLDWSPDGKTLVFSAWDEKSRSHRLFELALGDFAVRPVDLDRPDSAGDFQPRYSPSGKTLAWIGLDQTGRTGLFTAAATGGPTETVLMGLAALQGLAWSPDGAWLVYAAAPAGRFDLWRVPVRGGPPHWVPTPGDFAWNPTIARRTGDLVYEEVRADQDLWRIRITGRDPWQLETGPFIRSTRWEYEADFSPDGGRVVFVSARSGRPELWVADREGAELQRLTFLEAAAVSNPRWSPRGNRIAFNAMMDGRSEIMVVQARGGDPHRIEVAAGTEGQRLFTAWGADGEHLLVSADKGEGWQIFREPLSGGPGLRLTAKGGLTAEESSSGEELFFTRPGLPGLWRQQAGEPSAEPELIISDLAHQDRRNWRYVRGSAPPGKIAWVMRVQDSAFLMFHDLGAGESSFLAELPGLVSAGLALSPGGDEVVFARTENMAGDLMLLEGAFPR